MARAQLDLLQGPDPEWIKAWEASVRDPKDKCSEADLFGLLSDLVHRREVLKAAVDNR